MMICGKRRLDKETVLPAVWIVALETTLARSNLVMSCLPERASRVAAKAEPTRLAHEELWIERLMEDVTRGAIVEIERAVQYFQAIEKIGMTGSQAQSTLDIPEGCPRRTPVALVAFLSLEGRMRGAVSRIGFSVAPSRRHVRCSENYQQRQHQSNAAASSRRRCGVGWPLSVFPSMHFTRRAALHP